MRNLVKQPLWQIKDLGNPIPDENPTSVCMPTVASVVGYEEGKTEVMSRIKNGYPRFVDESIVLELAKQYLPKSTYAIPLHSKQAAQRTKELIEKHVSSRAFAGMVEIEGGVYVVGVGEDPEAIKWLKRYRQHTGDRISARRAEDLIVKINYENPEFEIKVKDRLAEISGTNKQQIFMSSNGMNAIFHTMRAIRRLNSKTNKKQTIQFGFPYVDTFKLQEVFEVQQPVFISPIGSDSYDKLEKALATGRISAIFCEIPSNPLLETHDLDLIRQLADKYDALLVIDETIGGFYNINVLSYADIIVTSLTKSISGIANVMGGASIINPDSKYAKQLHKVMSEKDEHTLYWRDAEVLISNMTDYEKRMPNYNASALAVVNQLNGLPEVKKVYHPSLATNNNFRKLMTPHGGFGGLFSVVFNTPEFATKFFDNLKVSKGPSLGSDFTLACPYTLLAHYAEQEWAKKHNIDPYLIRVSAGSEDPSELAQRFQEAYDAASQAD